MKIQSIEINNFKALKGYRRYEFTDGITGIVGANGQGKSNLTRAIAWALYGPLVFEKGMSSADVISWGESSALVSLEFEVADTTYHLSRRQSASGSEAHLTDGHLFDSEGADAVTKSITEILGIDRVGFLASVFSRQKDLEGLASLSGPDRTKTVLRLRGLDQVSKAIENAGKDGSAAKSALAVVRSTVPTLRSLSEYDSDIKVTGKNAKKAEADLEGLKSRQRVLQQEVESLVQEQSALAPKRKDYLDYVSAQASARSHLLQATNALEEAEALASEEEPVPPDPPVITFNLKRFNSLTSKQAEDREFVRTLKATLNAKDTCPTCLRPYDNADDLRKAREKAQQAHAAATKRIDKRQKEIDFQEAARRQEEEFKERQRQWQADVERWKSHRIAVEEAHKALDEANAMLASLEPVEDVSDRYDFLSASIREREQEVNRQVRIVAEQEAEIQRLNDKVRELKEQRRLVQESAGHIRSLESQVLALDVTVAQLKEFKKLQTASLAPEIQIRASDILTQLTDGKYSELVLTPEWDIQYRFEDGELKGFANLSVGERNVFALSLRLALADLQASRIGLLVLDEVLDALDEDRQNLAWNVVEGLLNRYNQIFMVTHVPAFRERAPHLIQL